MFFEQFLQKQDIPCVAVNLPNLLALLSIRGIFVQIMEINSSHAIRKDVAAMTV